MYSYLKRLKHQAILCSVFIFPVAAFSDVAILTEPALDDDIDKTLQRLNQQLKSNNKDAGLYTSRGHLYFRIKKFDEAIDDYTTAINIAPDSYEAYFGRGLANGRLGYIKDGINDLSVYIKKYPDSSLAYTKRGVRYLWLQNNNKALIDFKKALKLNPDNAEAHDDIGVIYAKNKQYQLALQHFNRVVKIDPSYQKGFHNLAMTYYLTGMDNIALQNVDIAIKLSPAAKNSILLKSEILKAMGQLQEASELQDDALFLPEGNWHEQAPVE